MMKYVVLLAIFAVARANNLCNLDLPKDIPHEWGLNNNVCKDAMNGQVKQEIEASLKYLTIASHFSQDYINRPGFAKFFFDAASEEREHAKKIIEYLMLRGDYSINEVKSQIADVTIQPMEKSKKEVDIINDALNLEQKVTANIRKVIDLCREDDHLTDYLSGDFLLEQYEGMKDLAGKLSTLKKLYLNTVKQPNTEAEIGLFIIDKKLLNGEVL